MRQKRSLRVSAAPIAPGVAGSMYMHCKLLSLYLVRPDVSAATLKMAHQRDQPGYEACLDELDAQRMLH